uniref:Transposase n=1 Tax=Ascaris lumbricoides TaxID=6252 RepID=A0A0M3IX36_ASCLU
MNNADKAFLGGDVGAKELEGDKEAVSISQRPSQRLANYRGFFQESHIQR